MPLLVPVIRVTAMNDLLGSPGDYTE